AALTGELINAGTADGQPLARYPRDVHVRLRGRRGGASTEAPLILAPQAAERLAIHPLERARGGVRQAPGRRAGEHGELLRAESFDEILVKAQAIRVCGAAARPVRQPAVDAVE